MPEAHMAPGAAVENVDPSAPFANKIMPPDLIVGTDPWVPISERYDWPAVFAWLSERYCEPITAVDIFVFDSEGISDDAAVRQDLERADSSVLDEVVRLPEFLGYLSGTPDAANNNRNRTLCFWLPNSRDVIRAATDSEVHRDAASKAGAYEERWPVRWRITNTPRVIVFDQLNRDWELLRESEQRTPVSARFIVAGSIAEQ